MTDTTKRELVGWCENDDCGEPIYLAPSAVGLRRPWECRKCTDATRRAEHADIDAATITDTEAY